MRHKPYDGVVKAIRAWFNYMIPHCLEWYKLLAVRARLPSPTVQNLILSYFILFLLTGAIFNCFLKRL